MPLTCLMGLPRYLSHSALRKSLGGSAKRPNQPINNQPNNQNRSSQSLARSASTCVKGGKNCRIVAGGARVYLSLISLNPDEPGHHHHCSARADITDGPGRAQTGGRNGGQSSGGRLQGGTFRGLGPWANAIGPGCLCDWARIDFSQDGRQTRSTCNS